MANTVETSIAPDIQRKRDISDLHFQYCGAFAKLDGELLSYGTVTGDTFRQYIRLTKQAMALISVYLQRDKFKNIRKTIQNYMVLPSHQDYIIKRYEIKEAIDKAYYITGLIEIDQAVKFKTYDLDAELRPMVFEFLQECIEKGELEVGKLDIDKEDER